MPISLIGIWLIKKDWAYKRLIDRIFLITATTILASVIGLLLIGIYFIDWLALLLSVIIFIIFTIFFTSKTIEIWIKRNLDCNDVVRNNYEKDGRLYKWYWQTYRFLKKRNWLSIVFKRLTDDEFIPLKKGQQFIFVSPTGNRGYHEKDFAELLGQRRKNNTFIVSDIANFEDSVLSYSNDTTDFRYLPSMDANNIKVYLEEQDIFEVDCIWDIKGWLWYSKHTNAEHVFKKYNEILKDGGIIVIDAKKPNFIMDIMGKLYYGLTYKIGISLSEESTHHLIRKCVKTSEFVQQNFNEYILGKGLTRIVVYQKKTQ